MMLSIGSDFPGGNIIFEGIADDKVRLRQDQRDTLAYPWFYWYFEVNGAACKRLYFEFEERVIGVRGPGVSFDRGVTWQWLGTELGDEKSFVFSFPCNVAGVRFSFGMPYTQANLERFIVPYKNHPNLRVDTLCRSRKGREVEALYFGRIKEKPEHRILLTARHHACEMMASYVLEGIMEAVLAEDERGQWMRERVEFMAVPFVDKDGAEEGDQGKGREPYDHNRDYAEGIYPEVRALKETVSDWAEDKLRMAFDLHCPGPRGEWHEQIHFVGVPEARLDRQIDEFSSTLEEVNRGPLPYKRSNNLPFGVDWNTGEELGPPDSPPVHASDWYSSLPGVWFGATLEMPYANAQGAEVNAPTARAFGRELGVAIYQHLLTA